MEARRRDYERREERPAGRVEPVERETRDVTEYGPDYGRGTAFAMRDLIHWGPVWAGVIGGFATLILLTLLGLAIGLAGFDAAPAPGDIGTAAFIWGAIVLLVAYFVGGWFAGRTSSYHGTTLSAFFLGTMVWALSVVLLVLMASIGVAGVFGAVLGPMNLGAAPGITPGDVAATAQSTALWSFITLLVALAAAIGGAYVGSKSIVTGTEER